MRFKQSWHREREKRWQVKAGGKCEIRVSLAQWHMCEPATGYVWQATPQNLLSSRENYQITVGKRKRNRSLLIQVLVALFVGVSMKFFRRKGKSSFSFNLSKLN